MWLAGWVLLQLERSILWLNRVEQKYHSRSLSYFSFAMSWMFKFFEMDTKDLTNYWTVRWVPAVESRQESFAASVEIWTVNLNHWLYKKLCLISLSKSIIVGIVGLAMLQILIFTEYFCFLLFISKDYEAVSLSQCCIVFLWARVLRTSYCAFNLIK